MKDILDRLARPGRLFTSTEVRGRSSCVPREQRFYGWYFHEVPETVPCAGCEVRDRATLLYVGIAPESDSSRKNLRSRLAEHFRGNAYGSTLRLSLGCLLGDRLGIELRRTASGKRMTFGPGERSLSDWLAQHALITFSVVAAPWRFEAQIINAISLPLNLEHNERHEFHGVLSALRSSSKKRARALSCWPA